MPFRIFCSNSENFDPLSYIIDHKLKNIKNFDCIQLYEKRIKKHTIMQKTHHSIYILESFFYNLNIFFEN